MRAASLCTVLFAWLSLFAAAPALAQSAAGSLESPGLVATQPGTNPPWMFTWLGGGGQSNAPGGFYGGWGSTELALNPTHNLWTNGFVARLEGLDGHYNYGTTAFAGGLSNVFLSEGSLMFGYRMAVGNGLLTGFVGTTYEDDDNPDPTAVIRGLKGGGKVLGEYYGTFGPTFDFFGEASYSTIYNSYFAVARPGVHVASNLIGDSNLWVGPEGSVFGNDAPYSEAHAGAFAHLLFPNGILEDVILDGGYLRPLTTGSPPGWYAQIGFGLNFR